MRAIHRWLLTLFLAAVAVQFFLAGLGAFKAQHGTEQGRIGDSQFADYFSPHRAFANVLEIIAILVLLAALVGRMGRRWILVSLSLPILVELQYVFAGTGPTWFRALHVVNALVIAAIAGRSTGRAWSEARA
jgi:hypothetical protein